MKKTLLICSGLIIFVPLICIGADITQKVGAMIRLPLTVQNMQNLSFGTIIPYGLGTGMSVGADASVDVDPNRASVIGAHPGIIKIVGDGSVAITSTPPSVLTHVDDSTKTIRLTGMKIVYSDGSAISNKNNVEITNNEIILKTIGALASGSLSDLVKPGEYKADWPITVVYNNDYEPE